MTDILVFNGDADGICAAVQLYRAAPNPDVHIVTGRKRDIKLLSRVDVKSGDRVTVLDISMHSNKADLLRILETGAKVFYADHHNAGEIPAHENLTALIDTSPETCTAEIVDKHLGGTYRAWAVCAAFGDNFPALAQRMAAGHDLPLETLQRLGILINYNGYGASEEDLHFRPKALFKSMRNYDTPMTFLSAEPDVFKALDEGYRADMDLAKAAKVIDETENTIVLELPDCAASRRVSGVYSNDLAQKNPNRAHAMLTRTDSGYVVSVRAPLSNRTGADTLCLQFETGGGRSAAAGINLLPFSDLPKFITAFRAAF